MEQRWIAETALLLPRRGGEISDVHGSWLVPGPFLNRHRPSRYSRNPTDRTSLAFDDTFRGGFYIGKASLTPNLLTTELGSATFEYFVKGNGSGSVTYNGTNYYTFDEYKTINSGLGLTGVERSVVNVLLADFASGTITTGQVPQFVIVPEPGALALAGIGIAAAAYALRRRK